MVVLAHVRVILRIGQRKVAVGGSIEFLHWDQHSNSPECGVIWCFAVFVRLAVARRVERIVRHEIAFVQIGAEHKRHLEDPIADGFCFRLSIFVVVEELQQMIATRHTRAFEIEVDCVQVGEIAIQVDAVGVCAAVQPGAFRWFLYVNVR